MRFEASGIMVKATQMATCIVSGLLWSWGVEPAAIAADRPPRSSPLVTAQRGLVVSVSPEASDAGLQILQQGGNAVDAAVAVALALAVTYPEAGNIGGGGFMMVWPGHAVEKTEPEDRSSDGQRTDQPAQPLEPAGRQSGSSAAEPVIPPGHPVCIEYRELCPLRVGRETFVAEQRSVGIHTVGVPGTPRGLALAHQRFGRLPWKDLVQPAIRLAETGFAIDESLATTLNQMLERTRTEFPTFAAVFAAPHGKPWQTGERLIQPELARTLRRMAEHGADEFYTGETARQIVAEMNAAGGFITADDLAGYRARIRLPVHTQYRGHDVYAPGPPSAGGIQLCLCLNMLEPFSLGTLDPHSAQWGHLLAEVMKRAACERVRYVGDPDLVSIPPHLTDKTHAARLMQSFSWDHATPAETLAPEISLTEESPSTTHFSVIDQDGMAVANTYTLQDAWGSRVVVRGGGFLLNNEMTDFNWKPGITTRNGRVGTDPNLMAPGKRMLSSQTPTLVAHNGQLRIVTGSPGGRTIPSTVLSVVLHVIDRGADASTAVAADRWHHQWLPDRLSGEGIGTTEMAAALTELQRLGHTVRQPTDMGGGLWKQGDAHTIVITPHGPTAAADYRRTHGKAAGW
jgi:gamma-glutamyltranspeptidase / glutathione hydrolase